MVNETWVDASNEGRKYYVDVAESTTDGLTFILNSRRWVGRDVAAFVLPGE